MQGSALSRYFCANQLIEKDLGSLVFVGYCFSVLNSQNVLIKYQFAVLCFQRCIEEFSEAAFSILFEQVYYLTG